MEDSFDTHCDLPEMDLLMIASHREASIDPCMGATNDDDRSRGLFYSDNSPLSLILLLSSASQ